MISVFADLCNALLCQPTQIQLPIRIATKSPKTTQVMAHSGRQIYDMAKRSHMRVVEKNEGANLNRGIVYLPESIGRKFLGDDWDVLQKIDPRKRDPSIDFYIQTRILFEDYYRKHRVYFYAKFAIDQVGAIIALVLFSPVMLTVALALKLQSPTEPIFFTQWRLGLRGRPFRIFKFRTMKAIVPEKESFALLSKERHEYRITRLGKFLRDKKLDELPQLLNVLRGNMSLVGPRPYSLIDYLHSPKNLFASQCVKPGLTGIWQTQFSSLINGRHKIRLDIFYAKLCSTKVDIYLLFLTIPRVIFGERYARRGRKLRQNSGSWTPKNRKAA